jgi:response regulator of citrate/malate metabolism
MDDVIARIYEHFNTKGKTSKERAALELVDELMENETITTTLKELAKRWNWSFKTVDRFLGDLDEHKIIKLKQIQGKFGHTIISLN